MLKFKDLEVPLDCHPDGSLRIQGTKICFEQIVTEFEGGVVAEEIAMRHKGLDLSEVYLVLAYYLLNRSEVESYLVNRSQAKESKARPQPAA